MTWKIKIDHESCPDRFIAFDHVWRCRISSADKRIRPAKCEELICPIKIEEVNGQPLGIECFADFLDSFKIEEVNDATTDQPDLGVVLQGADAVALARTDEAGARALQAFREAICQAFETYFATHAQALETLDKAHTEAKEKFWEEIFKS